MSNKTPPKNRKARSDSMSPSTGEAPGSSYSPKGTRAKTPASATHPPSNTAFSSSLSSTGNSPTKKNSANDSARIPYGPPNIDQIRESTTAPPNVTLAIDHVAPVDPVRPTSGAYQSKPLEPGYATAGLDLTKPAMKEEANPTTRDFGTETEGWVGGEGAVKVEEEKEMSTDDELEAIKRAKKALLAETDDMTVVETVKKTE